MAPLRYFVKEKISTTRSRKGHEPRLLNSTSGLFFGNGELSSQPVGPTHSEYYVASLILFCFLGACTARSRWVTCRLYTRSVYDEYTCGCKTLLDESYTCWLRYFTSFIHALTGIPFFYWTIHNRFSNNHTEILWSNVFKWYWDEYNSCNCFHGTWTWTFVGLLIWRL